jgi:hypothetical protein
MLNKKKQITNISKKEKSRATSFFNLPQIPKMSYVQIDQSENALSELNIILKKKSKKHSVPFRFSFSQNDLKSYFFFTKHFVQQRTKKSDMKKRILFLRKLFKKKRLYSFYFMKKIKGGFFTSSLGSSSFTPKSLTSKVYRKVKKQYLVGFKFLKKKNRFSHKKFMKINLVSSSKKSVFLK